MTHPAVLIPDVERLVIDYLQAIRGTHFPAGATIGVGIPATWTPAAPAHIQIVSDGTPTMTWPIVASPTVRVVVRAASTTLAKSIAAMAMGLLCAGGWPPSFSILPLTGVLPASDPDTRAQLASFTLRVTVRSQPIL